MSRRDLDEEYNRILGSDTAESDEEDQDDMSLSLVMDVLCGNVFLTP
jgi:hypothetical protein